VKLKVSSLKEEGVSWRVVWYCLVPLRVYDVDDVGREKKKRSHRHVEGCVTQYGVSFPSTKKSWTNFHLTNNTTIST
jgi:hypothetical protein